MVDVQNTLVNIAVQGWGSEEQKAKYLPKLATVFINLFHCYVSLEENN